MEEYKSSISEIKYLSYNPGLKEYGQKYIGGRLSMGLYNDFIKSIPRESHLGKYEPLK